MCTWDITVYDRYNHPTTLYFDLVNGSSPLIIGLDVGRYVDIINNSDLPHIRINRPEDKTPSIFNIYLSSEGEQNPDCIRMKLQAFPEQKRYITSMMTNLRNLSQTNPALFAKRIHRYTHAHPDQIRYLCDKAGILDEPLQDAIIHMDKLCGVCVQNGRPLPSKKVSLTHVNEEFNQEVQVDFTFVTVHESQNPRIPPGSKYTIIVFADTGTKYSESDVVEQRSADQIIGAYERVWICRHGASKSISADDEYNRKRLRDYLASHDIELKSRPTRRHNKTGIVERTHGRLKNILKRLLMENTQDDFKNLLARANLFANMFAGSQTLSAFEQARGYQPSIIGIPQTEVSHEMLNAHTQQMATRALQRILRSRTPNIPTPGMFKPNDIVWVWYASTKNNEPDAWIRAQVVKPHTHYLEVKRYKNGQLCRGPSMKPAYEDVRIAPKNELARSLMEDDLQTALGYGSSTEGRVDTTLTETVDTPNRISSMIMNFKRPKDATNDIGSYAHQLNITKVEMVRTLQSERKRILNDIYENIGSHQVSRSKLAFAPPWILEEAFQKEYDSNWRDAYESTPEKDVPRSANVITSHTVYKIKTDENGIRQLKNRIVPHGNRDVEKDSIRKDSATAQLNIIRLLLSITTFLGFRLGSADIKGAYLQSGPIQRDIYVRPPHEWKYHETYQRYTLWKLLKPPYGIVEAGRQWQKTVEEWMLNDYKMERVFGISQLFVQRNACDNIGIIIAKVTDDFLIGGSVQRIKHFIEQLEKRFNVGKYTIDSKFQFNGCEIEQDATGTISMSMLRYKDRLKPLEISRSRRKMTDDRATDKELTAFRALAGTLLYLGNGVLPQASYVVSLMQQQTGKLQVRHLIEANKMLVELLELKPRITFTRPSQTTKVSYFTFSDASHPKDRDYGQTGIVSGLLIETDDYDTPLFHPIDWTSFKQHRVSYSSYGAEILAAAGADDRGFYFKCAMRSLFPHLETTHELTIDSHCLFDTITTLHESTEYRLRPTVQRIRNSFEARELDVLRWIPGTINVADALTKRCKCLWYLLNEMCAQGSLIIDLGRGEALDSKFWQ